MDLVPKNVGSVYANKQSAHVYLHTVTVCCRAQLVIEAFSGFRLFGAFRVCFKLLWTVIKAQLKYGVGIHWWRADSGLWPWVSESLVTCRQWTVTVCEWVTGDVQTEDCDCLWVSHWWRADSGLWLFVSESLVTCRVDCDCLSVSHWWRAEWTVIVCEWVTGDVQAVDCDREWVTGDVQTVDCDCLWVGHWWRADSGLWLFVNGSLVTCRQWTVTVSESLVTCRQWTATVCESLVTCRQ